MGWIRTVGAKARLVQESIAYSLLAIAALLASFEVVSRYLFNSSHAWAEELVKLSILYAVFIAAGITLWSGGHIGIDFILRKFKGKVSEALHLVINIATFSASVLFSYSGILVVHKYFTLGVIAPIEFHLPMAVIFLPLPIGFGLLSIYSFAMIAGNVTRLKSSVALTKTQPRERDKN